MVGGVIPPVLNRQKSLLPSPERLFLPARMGKAMVIRLGREKWATACFHTGRMGHQPQRVLLRTLDKFQLPPRRTAHVQRPIAPGLDEGMR